MELLKSKEFQPKNYTQKEIMDESLRNYKNAFRIFFTSGTVSCLMFTLLPILTNQNNLPFDAWYPYNWKESPWYEITYGHQIVSTFFLTFTNIGIDCFSAGMMAVVGCQCEILGHTLLNLYEFSRLELDDEREDRNDIFGRYNEQFENLIGHHKNILM
ncbi:hypothetical protein HHI36_019173 [Cryptolaemus montrouzieri]|uniref:Uncharacterized protein n=1 Tax=Cryptolaemus montrouzieri TaxID=559131 RepID=A0ABD2P224_9CUCU